VSEVFVLAMVSPLDAGLLTAAVACSGDRGRLASSARI
jgi:hypothetical protein